MNVLFQNAPLACFKILQRWSLAPHTKASKESATVGFLFQICSAFSQWEYIQVLFFHVITNDTYAARIVHLRGEHISSIFSEFYLSVNVSYLHLICLPSYRRCHAPIYSNSLGLRPKFLTVATLPSLPPSYFAPFSSLP